MSKSALKMNPKPTTRPRKRRSYMRQFLICSCFLNQGVPKNTFPVIIDCKKHVPVITFAAPQKKTQHSDTKTKTAEIHEKNLAGTLEKSLHFGGKIHLLRPKGQMFPSAICPHVAQTSRVLSEIPLFTASKIPNSVPVHKMTNGTGWLVAKVPLPQARDGGWVARGEGATGRGA